MFPEAPEPWIDLSTGINPHSYPHSPLPASALARLPDTDREILLMRTFEGATFEEVALVLNVKPEAVRKRYGRALLRLHRLLLESGFKESDF